MFRFPHKVEHCQLNNVREFVVNIQCQVLSPMKSTIQLIFRLLALVVPKNDKTLAQRVLLRTAKRGATTPDYLWKSFRDMMLSLVTMTTVTEALRNDIQRYSENLNHLQMVYFFQRTLKTPQAVYNFCQINA